MNQATTSTDNVSATVTGAVVGPPAAAAAAATTTSAMKENNHHHNNTKNEKERTEFVTFNLYWDEWSRCIGSRYQTDHLYRVGKLDSCSRQWKDLKVAAKAKFIQYKNPDEAEKLINSTYYKKRTTISPTAGAIWELKSKPGWD